MTGSSVFGLLLVIFSLLINKFIFCLIGIPFIGLSQTIGSTTIFGFLKGFDPIAASGFACGTGFAGISGTLLFLLIQYMNINYIYFYCFLIFLDFVYYRVFLKLIDQLLEYQNYRDRFSPV